MSSKWADDIRDSLGLRVAAWYAAVFVTSTTLLVALTYALLSSSLKQRDHEIVTSTLREYASRYETGGLPALARAVELEVRSGGHERLFVRVLGPGQDALFFSLPPEWSAFDVEGLSPDASSGEGSSGAGAASGTGRAGGGGGTWAAARARGRQSVLEVASLRLWDGTIVQVGKSTESRDELLAHFRAVVGVVSLGVILIGVAGGIVLTRSTLQPVRHLIRVVRGIIETGRTDARVPVSVSPTAPAMADSVEALSALFNVMLDRITTLITAMRDSLDNVAHDLRTPMARLRGMAERALESGDPEAQREALANCLEESDRILAMLTTLMDISEAEIGTLRLTFEKVSLPKLIAEVVDLYEEVAEDKGIAMRVAPGTNVPNVPNVPTASAAGSLSTSDRAATADEALTVEADRDRLRQVLANLLDNALKYTGSGGKVTIAAEARGDEVVITVRDTGIGITPEDLPRIWDRLYRGDRSRAERGLGLGLSLVQAYVHAHGGRVIADSTPGQGSTFTVVLPRFS